MENPTQIDELPLTRGVQVLASNDDGLVALEKPIKVMSHPNSASDRERSILDAGYDYDGEFFVWTNEAGEERRAWLINRLDSPTSGVILLGLNPEISETIKLCFATHKVVKTYYALVKRKPSKPNGSWSDVLRKDVKNGARVIRNGQSVKAKASYQFVRSPIGGFPIALIKLLPVTGRTHQLRVQCKKHGHPIVGDRTYGSFSFNREVAHETGERRMMLHSGETTVKYAYKGKLREFKATSELPEAFHAVMGFRPGLRYAHEPVREAFDKSRPKPNKRVAPKPNKRVLPKPQKRSLQGRRFKR
ncbi:MAG: RluA family pseudouridine synthase [Opitutaceae bacterium]